jgi:nucleoside-diphosphate-sugar epimerase
MSSMVRVYICRVVFLLHNANYVYLTDVYGATKVEAEKAVKEANGKDNGTKDKLMTVAIRPHSIYGPGDRLFFPPVVKSAKVKSNLIILRHNIY